MAPIIPAGGKRMEWIADQGHDALQKKAQGMFEDDPQLQAIKGLPGMQDGIDELETMSAECDAPPCAGAPGAGEGMVSDVASPVAIDIAPAGAAAGGAVEKAIEKVKDAAQGVADAAVKDVEKAVTDAVKGAGKPKVEEIKPEEAHEKSETPAEEAKEEHEKSETPAKEEKEEKGEKDEKPEIPGVEGEKGGKVEKEGDKDKDDKDEKKDKDEKPAFASAVPRLRRIAELAPGEVKDLRHYWEGLLGFPKEYVDAMLKNYKA